MVRNDLIYLQKQSTLDEILTWALKQQQEYSQALETSRSVIPGDSPGV